MEISRRFLVESPLSTFHPPLLPLSFPSSLFTIDADTPDCNSPALQSRIVGMVEGRVRRLKGYQKSHHLPDGHHAAAQAFVRKVGHENVKELVDQFYTDIRSLFGYKRRDIRLHLRRWLRLHQRRPTSTYKCGSIKALKIRRIINSPPQSSRCTIPRSSETSVFTPASRTTARP